MRTPSRPVYAAAAVTAGLTLTLALAPDRATAAPSFGHWSQRSLVISDRTGDPGWQEATRRAVDTWNAVGMDLRLTWSEGGRTCDAEGTTVPVCRAVLRSGWTAAATIYHAADGHLGGARIRVSPRAFTQRQRDTIACHEVGHALGLDHSRSSASCLAQGSSSTTPDAADAASIRASYAHEG